MSIPAWAIPDIEQNPCILCGRLAYGSEQSAQCDECREYLRAAFNVVLPEVKR
jgi:hypothetical protein